MLHRKQKNSAVSRYYIISSIQSVTGGFFGFIFGLTTINSILNLGRTVKSEAVIVSFVLFVIFLLVFIRGINRQQLVNQYFRYMELLNQRKSYSIDELAAILSESHNMIKYNVEKMIKENFFEYVYMDDNTNRLINTIFGEEEQTYSKMKWETVEAATSESDAEEAETFDVVEEEEPVVKSDRMIQIVCMNCGAPNKVYSNSTAECMYCGSIIN